MRVVMVIGVLLAGGAATLSAQHGHQLEIGGFGSYTRYDRAFGLDDQFGGGARLGFFLNDYLGIEVDANIAQPSYTVGGAKTTATFAGASLVLNSGGESNILYVLGGYARMHIGPSGPMASNLNAVQGGIGDRVFVGDRVARRLEARGYYRPGSATPTGLWVGHVTGTAGLSFFLGPSHRVAAPEIPKERAESILAAGGKVPEPERPRAGPGYERRTSDWRHKWYWGAQGGVVALKTNFDSYAFEPTFGGHWLITARKTALYAAYDQSFFFSPRRVTIIEPDGTVNPGNVEFNNLRRIMVGVLAFPAQLRVEPFGGVGFAIMEALNVRTSCASCTSIAQIAQLQDEANNAATKAFFWWMGGVDIKQGRLAIYGHYIITSSAASFLVQGTTHTFQGGIRYSLGSSKEGITDRY